MKKYVRGYGPMSEEGMQKLAKSIDPFKPINNHWVEFSDTSDNWKVATFDEADMHCRDLNGMQVHIGSHYCEFSVEELPEGEFAIICLNHPR